jgi:hypothetical protein
VKRRLLPGNKLPIVPDDAGAIVEGLGHLSFPPAACT